MRFFDVIIGIKIQFFRISVTIEPGRSLLQFVTTNCLIKSLKKKLIRIRSRTYFKQIFVLKQLTLAGDKSQGFKMISIIFGE